jgi:hypothetical protein
MMDRKVKLFRMESDTSKATVVWSKVEDGYAYLVGWGIESEEVTNGVLTYTVGIIEKDDGTFVLLPLHLFQLI